MSFRAIKLGEAFFELTARSAKLRSEVKSTISSVTSQVAAFSAKTAALGTAALAPMALMTRQFVNLGDEVAKAARRVGIGAADLAGLRHAADLAGVSAGEVQVAFRYMARRIHTDTAESRRALDRLGLSADELKKKTPTEQFFVLADAIRRIQDPSLRSAISLEIFGRSGDAMIPLFEQGSAVIREQAEEFRELTGATDEQYRRAELLKDAQTRMQTALRGISMEVGSTLAPALIDATNKLTGLVRGVSGFIRQHPVLVSGSAKIVAGITGLSIATGTLAFGVGKAAILFGKLKIAVLALGGPFSALAGAVLIAAGALAKYKLEAAAAREESEALTRQISELREKAERERLGGTEEKIQERLVQLQEQRAELLQSEGRSLKEIGNEIDAAQARIRTLRQDWSGGILAHRRRGAEQDELRNTIKTLNEEYKSRQQHDVRRKELEKNIKEYEEELGVRARQKEIENTEAAALAAEEAAAAQAQREAKWAEQSLRVRDMVRDAEIALMDDATQRRLATLQEQYKRELRLVEDNVHAQVDLWLWFSLQVKKVMTDAAASRKEEQEDALREYESAQERVRRWTETHTNRTMIGGYGVTSGMFAGMGARQDILTAEQLGVDVQILVELKKIEDNTRQEVISRFSE